MAPKTKAAGFAPLLKADVIGGLVILRGSFCDTWLSMMMTPEVADHVAEQLHSAADRARAKQRAGITDVAASLGARAKEHDKEIGK